MKSRLYDVILFDVGATLLNFDPMQRARAWAEVVGTRADRIDDAFTEARTSARELVGKETAEEYELFRHEICSRTLDALHFEGDRRTAIAAMSDVWIQAGWEPFPEVVPVLSQLRTDGFRLGVVSNWTATLDWTLAHVGLAEFFDVVTCSAVVGAVKPDPRIFQHALRFLEVQPARALYVGDHYEVDVLGAREVGMEAVLILRGEVRAVAADEPLTIRSLNELRPLLGR